MLFNWCIPMTAYRSMTVRSTLGYPALENVLLFVLATSPAESELSRSSYQRNNRLPRSAPTIVGTKIPKTYQTARNGASISGQWMQ